MLSAPLKSVKYETSIIDVIFISLAFSYLIIVLMVRKADLLLLLEKFCGLESHSSKGLSFNISFDALSDLNSAVPCNSAANCTRYNMPAIVRKCPEKYSTNNTILPYHCKRK